MDIRAKLWQHETENLQLELADSNAVTLTAAEAEDAVVVLERALEANHSQPVVRVDLGRAVTHSSTAAILARQTAAALAGGEDLLALSHHGRSVAQSRRLLDIRRSLGVAFMLLDGHQVSPARAIAASLTALADYAAPIQQRAVLIMVGAERALIDKQFAALLWSIRSTAQTLGHITIVFCGNRAATELTRNPEAAFYGWGTEISLAVSQNILAELIEERLRAAQTPGQARRAARFVAELSHNSVSVAEQLTDLLISRVQDCEAVDVLSGWTELQRQHSPRLRVMAAAVSELGSQALPVAVSIANGEPPYRTVGAHGTTVSRALTALRATGVADRTGRTRWHIVDPLFAAWLRSA